MTSKINCLKRSALTFLFLSSPDRSLCSVARAAALTAGPAPPCSSPPALRRRAVPSPAPRSAPARGTRARSPGVVAPKPPPPPRAAVDRRSKPRAAPVDRRRSIDSVVVAVESHER